MTTPRLEVRGLVAGYGGRAVVHGLDLTVGEGEMVGLLGANGAGKTTSLGAMTGLVPAMAGEVLVDGVALRLRSTRAVARSGVALVPEDRSLFPSLTVRDHLRLAVRPPRRRRPGRRGPAVESAIADAIRWFPPLEPLLGTRVGLLSGGEQQMVAIARAVVTRPRVLLLDEMSLGLAPIVVGSLLETIGGLAAETGCAVLLVEQHVSLALAATNRAYVLGRGRVTYAGESAALAADDATLLASYLGASNSTTVIGS